jgi:hypothetical protein
MTRCKSLLLGWVLAAATGCGIKHIPNSIAEKLPYEARIDLLEAENELAIAVDKIDEVNNEINRTRDSVRRAKSRYGAAKDEVGRASDDSSRQVAELAVIEADARVEYLRIAQKLNGRDLGLYELGLKCAYTRFELAKLNAARKAKLEGSESYDPKDFEAQAKSCDEDYALLRKEIAEYGKEVEVVRVEWDKKRADLAKKTFDARASPYVE